MAKMTKTFFFSKLDLFLDEIGQSYSGEKKTSYSKIILTF